MKLIHIKNVMKSIFINNRFIQVVLKSKSKKRCTEAHNNYLMSGRATETSNISIEVSAKTIQDYKLKLRQPKRIQ